MIKQFDLGAPKHEKPVRIRFGNETRCITALFERCYRHTVPTGKTWKVLVHVVPAPERQHSADALGVVAVEVPGAVEELLAMPERQKSERALDLLMTGVRMVAQERNWDQAPFTAAAEEVRRLDFRNEWVWGKRVRNSSKTLSAEVLVRHGMVEAEILARFFDTRGASVSVAHLVSDIPSEFVFFDHLGTFGWVDEGTVELTSRDGKRRLTARASRDG